MTAQPDDTTRDLLAAPPRVVNIGLEIFAANILANGGEVAHVRWSPPAGGNVQLATLLEKLRARS
jgi:FdrA protein